MAKSPKSKSQILNALEWTARHGTKPVRNVNLDGVVYTLQGRLAENTAEALATLCESEANSAIKVKEPAVGIVSCRAEVKGKDSVPGSQLAEYVLAREEYYADEDNAAPVVEMPKPLQSRTNGQTATSS